MGGALASRGAGGDPQTDARTRIDPTMMKIVGFCSGWERRGQRWQAAASSLASPLLRPLPLPRTSAKTDSDESFETPPKTAFCCAPTAANRPEKSVRCVHAQTMPSAETECSTQPSLAHWFFALLQ